MFSRILIENEVKDLPTTQKILKRFPSLPYQFIDRIDDVFGRVKKPYLQKRQNLQLFLGKKRGQLVKEAPDALVLPVSLITTLFMPITVSMNASTVIYRDIFIAQILSFSSITMKSP